MKKEKRLHEQKTDISTCSTCWTTILVQTEKGKLIKCSKLELWYAIVMNYHDNEMELKMEFSMFVY